MTERDHRLTAISPLDGRYRDRLANLDEFFSESALIRERVKVIVAWVIHLCDYHGKLFGVDYMQVTPKLHSIKDNLPDSAIDEILRLERQTNHDTMAAVHFVRDRLVEFPDALKLVHLGCTSEDVNSTAIARLVGSFLWHMFTLRISDLLEVMRSHELHPEPMLSHTHGQPATPTTYGKEIRVFSDRIRARLASINRIAVKSKWSGASGNHNTLHHLFPDVNWRLSANDFLEYVMSVEVVQNSTQIDSHDWLCEILHQTHLLNLVLVDLCRDMWQYASMGYLTFDEKEHKRTPSSTMPHKINPADFENAEGNAQMAAGVIEVLVRNLPVSRMQRDLVDSTLMRNLGVAFGHTLVAIGGVINGLVKYKPDRGAMAMDLHEHHEVLLELVQTAMRLNHQNPSDLWRKSQMGIGKYRALIGELDLPTDLKARLLTTPSEYLGYSALKGGQAPATPPEAPKPG